MENQSIDKALKEIFELLTEANIYVDQNAPWQLKKTDINRMENILSISVEIIKRATILLYPIIPSSCEKVFSILNLNFKNFNFSEYNKLPNSSYKINEPHPIFPRIDTND